MTGMISLQPVQCVMPELGSSKWMIKSNSMSVTCADTNSFLILNNTTMTKRKTMSEKILEQQDILHKYLIEMEKKNAPVEDQRVIAQQIYFLEKLIYRES